MSQINQKQINNTSSQQLSQNQISLIQNRNFPQIQYNQNEQTQNIQNFKEEDLINQTNEIRNLIEMNNINDLYQYIKINHISKHILQNGLIYLLEKYQKNQIFYQMLDCFLFSGIDVNETFIFNHQNYTLLMFGFIRNDIYFINEILKCQKDINQNDGNNKNAIIYSVLYNNNDNTEIFNLLLNNKANINSETKIETKNNFYEVHSVFTLACVKGLNNIVRILLEKKVNVNFQTKPNGDTGLHLAVQNKHFEIVRMLLNYPNINVDQLNNDKKKAFDIANVKGIIELFNNYYNIKNMNNNNNKINKFQNNMNIAPAPNINNKINNNMNNNMNNNFNNNMNNNMNNNNMKNIINNNINNMMSNNINNINILKMINMINMMNIINNNMIKMKNNMKNNNAMKKINNMNLMGKFNNQEFMNKMNVQNLNIKFPHKSGLVNIGQICYMNAAIECLSNIKEITPFFLSNYGNFNSEKQTLTFVYSNLLFELFLSNKNSISPNIFKQTIGELNPLFKGMHAADSKDLVFFLIERLHQENNILNANIIIPQKNFNQLEIESTNENLMLQNFLYDFKMKNNSVISDNFYGITRSIMICDGCKVKKFSFQTFNMQIFQLRKIKDDKMVKLGNNFDISININLYDAFYNQQETEVLKGENMIYCNNCKQLQNGSHQQSIYELPPILIIILNRGKNNQDFNEEFEIYEYLDFSKQYLVLNNNSQYKRFYLCGLIKHLGKSGSDGHFIAYCRNNKNENFLCYNDAIVTEVNVQDAMSSKISNKDEEKKTPYILFYHYY